MKRALLFTFRWLNALLVLFHLIEFIRDSLNVEQVLAEKFFPVSLASPVSFLLVGSLTAFLAADRRREVAPRSLAKCANLAALCFNLYWFVTFSIRRGWGEISVQELAVLLAMLLFAVGVPLVNALFFWRAPVVPFEEAPEFAVAETPPDLPPARRANFFVSHWRGDLPLGVAFGVNSWLAIATLMAIQKFLDDGGLMRHARAAAFFYGFTYIAALILGVWVFVGAWRSATRHVQGGRAAVWGSLAKIVIVLFFLNQFGPALWIYFPRAREHLNFFAGNEPVEPYQIQVSANGEVIEFRGGLRLGSALALQRALADLPGAKVLKIDSPGGRINEALKIMALVHERGLDTYASQRCMSAATLVLTAGKARGAEPGARIGFHACKSPSAKGTAGDASVMGGLVSAGVAEAFVHQVLAVPPSQMWFPTPEEMLRAGVLNSYGVFPPGLLAKTNAPVTLLPVKP